MSSVLIVASSEIHAAYEHKHPIIVILTDGSRQAQRKVLAGSAILELCKRARYDHLAFVNELILFDSEVVGQPVVVFERDSNVLCIEFGTQGPTLVYDLSVEPQTLDEQIASLTVVDGSSCTRPSTDKKQPDLKQRYPNAVWMQPQ